MPATYIGTSSQQQLKDELRRAVARTDDALQDLTSLSALMTTMLNDPVTPTDYSLIEQKFGYAAGQGQQIYTLVKDARDRITHSSVKDLVERSG